MNRYKITIEYDGTDYCGWQTQNNGISIQEEIEKAIFKYCGQKVSVYGSGRTDAGVHAIGQVAHFDLDCHKDPKELLGAVNFHLRPNKIAILNAQEVDESFHARFSAKLRAYIYKIIIREAPLILESHRRHRIKNHLNIEAMQEQAVHFIGTHDLTSFRSVHCQSKSPIRSIEKIEIVQIENKVDIIISAPSFLQNQVRIMVGTLLQYGIGNKDILSIDKIILSKKREKGGPTAPSCGLYLQNVDY